jgi:hypothetical protein
VSLMLNDFILGTQPKTISGCSEYYFSGKAIGYGNSISNII